MACKPGSVPGKPRGTVIHLGRPSPDVSCDRPGQRPGNRPVPPQRHSCPYLVLLRVGFAEPRLLPAARCALTAPFHPYRPVPGHEAAVYFLWHFPWGRPRRVLPGTLFPWSPDFPLPAIAGSDRPAIWHLLSNIKIYLFQWFRKQWPRCCGSIAGFPHPGRRSNRRP